MMADEMVTVGRISGVYGVRGWFKVYSYTQPRENIITYKPWYLYRAGQWQLTDFIQGKRHGKGVVAQIAECQDRDTAATLINLDIGILQSQLPALPDDEYYWSDLQGLTVYTTAGVELGIVDHLLETGANDVLMIKGEREHLVPFVIPQVVLTVDMEQQQIIVDWDPEF